MKKAITASERTTSYHKQVIALIALGQVIVATDFCVTSVALPTIGVNLQTVSDVLPWIATAFSLIYTGALILCGRFADLLGHRRICVLGLALFGLGTLGTAASPTIQLLLVSRVVEGFGAACLTPTSFSLINVLLPSGPVRHRAFAVFGITQGLSYILGLYGGGALVSSFGWRSAFLLNIPAIGAGLVLAWRVIPSRVAHSARHSIDVIGATLITSAIALVLIALSTFSMPGRASLFGLGAFAGGCVLLTLLYRVERKAPTPLIPLSLFQHPGVIGADIGTILMVAASASAFVLLSLFMQGALHFSAATAGLSMIPNSIAVMAGGQLASRGMARLTLRRAIVIGVAIFLFGILFVTFASRTFGYVIGVLPGMVAIGLGSTIANLSLMAMSTAAVPEQEQNLASAVLMTSQQIGVSLGISITFALIVRQDHGAGAFRAAFLGAAALGALSLLPPLLLARRFLKSLDPSPSQPRTA